MQKPFISIENFLTQAKPIELEIGTGRSHYLFERARVVPHHLIVGIEYKNQWVKQALKRQEREGVHNVLPLHGHVWDVVAEIFPSHSLSQIAIHFPDPWWKRRHQKRKVLNPAFVEILALKLQLHASLFLQTDVLSLFAEYLKLLENSPHLQNMMGPHMPCPENPLIAQSHREKKCLDQGIPIHRAWFKKIEPQDGP